MHTGVNRSIHVLLVDDNEQWARFIADELEAYDATMAVTIALSANEAILSLQRDDSVDCVVTDYRMPEIDGITLLERVREERPNLPFILVTGEGNEAVASRAITAGVTDYLRKDPRADQTTVFANRIERAVDQSRLRREVEESEQRYRTVIEQTSDAIVILRDGRIAYCNDRLAELVGEDVEALLEEDFLETVVDGTDHDHVRDILANVDAESDPLPHEVRLGSDGGDVRHCEVVGRTITYDSESAALLSIRDVTRRATRERQRQRERELDRSVKQALATSGTRDELEAAIGSVLSEQGYDLVWIGDVLDEAVEPRALEGDSEYLEALRASDLEGDHGGEPGLWAVRTAEPQLVPDFENLFPTTARELALDHGYRTGAAFPLRYDDVPYGVLAVYHERPNRIDDVERTILEDVAETVSFAIHHLETRRTLTDPRGVDVEIELTDGGHYLLDEVFDSTTLSVRVQGTQSFGTDGVIQYVSPSGISLEAFCEVAVEYESVEDATIVRDGASPLCQVTLTEPTPESRLASFGAVVRSTTVSPGRAIVRFELATRENLTAALESLRSEYGSVSVRRCVESARRTDDERSLVVELTDLTEKQAAALESAYRHGYFERPRRNSATEVADSIGITHSTYLQHLRVAQRKVFEQLYE